MFFIGIDVSKAKLDCCLLFDSAGSKRKSKSVANSKTGIADLLAWAAKHGIAPAELHAILEGTGVYHESAALALCDAGVTVSIVNPAQARDFGRGLAVRTKTDGVDSFVLARLSKAGPARVRAVLYMAAIHRRRPLQPSRQITL